MKCVKIVKKEVYKLDKAGEANDSTTYTYTFRQEHPKRTQTIESEVMLDFEVGEVVTQEVIAKHLQARQPIVE